MQMKIKMPIDSNINRLSCFLNKKRWNYSTIFLIGLSLSIVVHLQFFVSGFLINEDVLGLTEKSTNADTLGRFLIPFVAKIRGEYNSVMIIGTIAVLALALSALCIVQLFEIEKRVDTIICLGMVIAFSAWPYKIGYVPMADIYTLSFLGAVSSVYFTKKYKWGWIPGSICLSISLGLYQADLASAIVLSICCILLHCIKEDENLIRKIGRYAANGIIGLGLYLVSLQCYLHLADRSLSQYRNISELGKISFSDITKGFKEVWIQFVQEIQGNLIYAGLWIRKLQWLCIFLLIGSLIYFIIKKINKKRYWEAMLLLLCGTALPVGINIMLIAAPGNNLSILMIFQFVFVFILLLRLAEEIQVSWSEGSLKATVLIGKFGVLLVLSVLVLHFYKIDQIYYLKLHTYYERTYAVANRIVARMEELPGFETDLNVYVSGKLPNNRYKASDIQFPEILRDQGLWGQYVGLGSDQGYKFTKFVNAYLGVNMKYVNAEQEKIIKQTIEFQEMGIWPSEDSVKIIDNAVVVKLSKLISIQWEQLDQNRYRLKSDYTGEGFTYAWYIYHNNKRIEVIWYQSDSVLEYELTEPGEYYFTLFVDDGEGTGGFVNSKKIYYIP